MGLAASGKFPKVEIGAYYRPGRMFMLVIGAIGVFITSAFVVPPRAALTSYEIFLRPIMAGGFENVQATSGLHASAVIFLNLFSEKINNDNVYRGAVIAAGLWGIASGVAYIDAFTLGHGYAVYGSGWYSGFFFGKWNFVYTLVGDLGYVIPAAVGAVIGAFIKKGGYSERPYLREHAGDESFDYAALKAKKAAGQ
jgi:hypothetical protein